MNVLLSTGVVAMPGLDCFSTCIDKLLMIVCAAIRATQMDTAVDYISILAFAKVGDNTGGMHLIAPKCCVTCTAADISDPSDHNGACLRWHCCVEAVQLNMLPHLQVQIV